MTQLEPDPYAIGLHRFRKAIEPRDEIVLEYTQPRRGTHSEGIDIGGFDDDHSHPAPCPFNVIVDQPIRYSSI